MGVFQLMNPVLALSFAILAAGYQTAISKLTAEYKVKKDHSTVTPLVTAVSVCLPLSLLCTFLLYILSPLIGSSILHEPRTVSMIKILAFSIPFSTMHACFNGYFYGIKEAKIPAFSQLTEQLFRVGSVYLISLYAFKSQKKPTLNLAIFGIFLGELSAFLLCIIYAFYTTAKKKKARQALIFVPTFKNYRDLFSMALPLTANRLAINFLMSIESVSIPIRLRVYGYDQSTALSVFGVLTGMALPLLLFPNALTGSISVMLLPRISESYARKDFAGVKKMIFKTITYCGLMGILCTVLFRLLGNFVGTTLFHSVLAGRFITVLSLLCPFLYLDTTLSGILHGLGKAGELFVINVTCLTARLLFVFFAIPKYGILAYLCGILTSQLLQCVLYLCVLYQFMKNKKTGRPLTP